LSNLVQALDLVLADGRTITVSTNANANANGAGDSSLLAAACCSLGCLGAIYSVTLRCEPLFSVEEHTSSTSMPWRTFYAQMQPILRDWPLTQLTVDQFSPDLRCTVSLRRKQPYSAALGAGYQALSSATESGYYLEAETAMPRAAIGAAVEATAAFHQQRLAQTGIRSRSSLFVRFCAPDATLISMAAGRETAFVSSFFGHEVEAATGVAFLQDASDLLVQRFQGRPHWGKIHKLTPGDVRRLYGSNMDSFLSIRQQLDPTGVFANAYIARVLGV
jgi:FAD/FMN-containing dehydrogenase